MNNYSLNKQQAIAEMFDMNKRATKSPKPQNNHIAPIGAFSLDTDTIIILALMFILYNDTADFILIFALAYILI